MKKDRLGKKDFRFFVIPFLALIVIFGGGTYFYAQNSINNTYQRFEDLTGTIAESYSRSLSQGEKASEMITEILDEKIKSISEAILLMEDRESNRRLQELAEVFSVDEISLYTPEGELVHSNKEEYVGWVVYEDHPVDRFMKSGLSVHADEAREDTISGEYSKFGYAMAEDGSFVQVGILVTELHQFYESFEAQKLIEEFAGHEKIRYAFFIDRGYRIVAGNVPELVGTSIESEEMMGYLSQPMEEMEEVLFVESPTDELLHIGAPVYHDDRIIGMLSILWLREGIDREVAGIVTSSVMMFLIVLVTFSSILYYAYRKDSSNRMIAYYDQLTGLPNQVYLRDSLDRSIIEAEKEKKGVLLINCTNFKTLNLTYGYRYGDQILIQVAEKLKKLMGDHQRLFRFEADRFMVIVDGYKNSKVLFDLGNRIVDAFQSPIAEEGNQSFVTTKVAIMEIRSQDTTRDHVLQDVTLALSAMDKQSEKKIMFFNKTMEEVNRRQESIESALRAVVKNEDGKSFSLDFQPVLDLHRQTVTGFEGLARMNTESLGRIPPIEFIELAEQRMLIYDLGKVILEEACRFQVRLNKNGQPHLTVSVNISPIQLLRKEFLGDIKQIIDETGADPESLAFEITETLMITNFMEINRVLDEIRALGISIDLDDFGTGFSSFARLRDLHIDTVKIDREFIRNINFSDRKSLIIADIISMAHKFGLTVVAEGVETEEQMAYLKENHCDMIQGYLLSRPLPEEEALRFLGNTDESV